MGCVPIIEGSVYFGVCVFLCVFCCCKDSRTQALVSDSGLVFGRRELAPREMWLFRAMCFNPSAVFDESDFFFMYTVKYPYLP